MDKLLMVDTMVVCKIRSALHFLNDWLCLSRNEVNVILMGMMVWSLVYGQRWDRMVLASPAILALVIVFYFAVVFEKAQSPDQAALGRLMAATISLCFIANRIAIHHQLEWVYARTMFFYVLLLYVNADPHNDGQRGRKLRKSTKELKELFGEWAGELPAGAAAMVRYGGKA